MEDSNDSTQQDIIDSAIDMATTGDPGEAIRLLWPVMMEDVQRDQALFALAFCFEKAQNLSTAFYLYTETLNGYPAFTVAAARQQACRRVLEEKGLIEDFQDIGHRACTECGLRYRSEYLLCPYCGTSKDEAKKQEPTPEEEKVKEEALPGWEDPTLLNALQDLGRDVADRIQDVIESDAVKKVSGTMAEASKATSNKAKEWAESDTAQDLKKRSAKLGDDVMHKAYELSEKPAIRDLAFKIEKLSTSASDKMKQAIEKDSTQKAKAKAQRFGANIMNRIREALDTDKKDD